MAWNVRELRNLIERIAILSPDSDEKISNIIKESLKTPDIINTTSENSLSIPLKEARVLWHQKIINAKNSKQQQICKQMHNMKNIKTMNKQQDTYQNHSKHKRNLSNK